MLRHQLLCCLPLIANLACSSGSPAADAGTPDAGPQPDAGLVDAGVVDAGVDGGLPDSGALDAGSSCSADDGCSAGQICNNGSCVSGCSQTHACATGMTCVQSKCQSPVTGSMSLFEVEGALPLDGGSQTVKLMEAFVSFQGAVTHDYDDRAQGLGCTGDHYDATTKPLPADDDAGWLRMSGYTGGTLLSGAQAGQPVVCMQQSGYYSCLFPTGAPVTAPPFAAFSDAQSPLGTGSILFATAGGAAFGPTALSGAASGTLSVMESLGSISYSTTADTVLHVSCTDGCPSARFGVQLVAVAQSTLGMGWPYPSVGVVSCVLPAGATATIPAAAVSAMFAQDTKLDTVWSTVVRLAAAPLATMDTGGNPLLGEVGQGVFGVAGR